MSLTVRTLTFDCADATALASFWSAALGWNAYFDDDPEVLVAPSFPPPRGGAPNLLFIPVPEPKTAKNRLHLDVGSDVDGRDAEVARLVELGATVIGDHRTPEGLGWVVLQDPEGNEFCVERSDVERGKPEPKRYRLDVA
jgi:predicted enzyme related to lactoylglutathione lyase